MNRTGRVARSGLRPTRLAFLGLVLGLGGCSEKAAPEPKPSARDAINPIVEGTVGDITLLGDGGPSPVRGYGLVIGLGQQGSSDCPTALREYLVEYLNKEFLEPEPGRPKPIHSAGQMIDSLDTAVVQLDALVPPGARKGTRFDVQVSVVAGTNARSLEGGLLMLSELRSFDPTAGERGLTAGRVVAKANGPVFTNPFAEDDESGPADVRRGVVLGGAIATEARPVRLQLIEPSYPVARRIEQRINEVFGQTPRTAEAMNQGVVMVNTPAGHAQRPHRFVQLATHLYTRDEPGYLELRLSSIMERIGEADLEHVALVWEGVGRPVLPRVQPLYGHAEESVRFHAARAGLRVNDSTALPVLQQIALSEGSSFQLSAIRELADCDLLQAVDRLVPLLDGDNLEVRVAAYEALRRHGHPAVESKSIPAAIDPALLGLTLDVVKSRGRPVIYVRRSLEPGIALFGGDLKVALPMFYAHSDDRVILSAADGQDEITVSYKLPSAKAPSEPVTVEPRVEALIARLAAAPQPLDKEDPVGPGLSCSQIVSVLHRLCLDGTIDAKLELERVSMTDLFGPPPPPERPEGDNDALSPDASRPLLPDSSKPAGAGAGAARKESP